MKLTDITIKKAKPRETAFKLSDGGGLFIQVEPSGGKLWRYKYYFNGAEKKLALGKYPDISLQEARRLHQEAREQLARGIDPSVAKQTMKKTKGDLAANSFEAVAREWHTTWSKDKSPRHADYTMARLEKNVFPVIGRKPIAEIKASDALEVCRIIEKRGAPEMAHRILTIVSQVMRYAIITDRAERDPCPDLRGALQSVRARPMPSITEPSQIAGLLQSIDEYQCTFVVKSALLLAPLVFVRPGELRGARWEDMDFDNAEWTFQFLKQRTNIKDKQKLVVPLSRQALAILKDLHPFTGEGVYVFPGLHPGRPISDGTINKALRAMGYDTKTEITGHGFRAMARTVIAERLHMDTQWIERQLSHKTSERLGESYDRAQFLDDRRLMMQTWADYLDALKAERIKQRKNRLTQDQRSQPNHGRAATGSAKRKGPAPQADRRPIGNASGERMQRTREQGGADKFDEAPSIRLSWLTYRMMVDRM